MRLLLSAIAVPFVLVADSVEKDPSERRWKIVAASVSGPEGKALEIVTETVGAETLREAGFTNVHVLPVELVGGLPVANRPDVIAVGTTASNPLVCELLGSEAVPKGGYVVRTGNRGAMRYVLIAGDTPAAVLWGAFAFADEIVGGFENPRFFREVPLRELGCARAPETPIRSLFTWGHVIDDYRLFFREAARLGLNRVILWNLHPPVNAADVVREAHDWGLAVYWGFAWGWTSDMCVSAVTTDLKMLAAQIVEEFRSVWRPLGGDGIYFQTFTEQDREIVGGRAIAEMAAELVNDASAGIRAISPETDIVFGLHANSVKTRLGEIAKTDKNLEILWENCGGFPYFEHQGEPDLAFTNRILAERPRVGLVWKEQVRQVWSHWTPPAGPYLLGVAGRGLLVRDRALTDARQGRFTADWMNRGEEAYRLMRHVRASKTPPYEINLVAEYNPPFRFSTVLAAELAWGSREPYAAIRTRALLKCQTKGPQ